MARSRPAAYRLLRRRVLLTVIWLVGGGVAVSVGFGAVALVGDEVTTRSAAPLSQRAVEESLAARTLTTPPPANRPRGSGLDDYPTPIPSLTPRPDGATGSRPPSGSTTPAGTVPPSTPPASAAPTKLGSYQITGGHIGVACTGPVIMLRYAVPADGYRSDVHRTSTRVDVEFEGQGHHSQLSVTCHNGEPVSQVENDD